MTSTDDTALTGLAAEFPSWHAWRSRDSRGRGNAIAGMPGRDTAQSFAGLRSLLEQRRAVEAGTQRSA